MWTILIWFVGIYGMIAIFVFYAMINNIFFFRPNKYTLDFEHASIESKELENPRIRYHLVRHNNSIPEKWVVIFHSWGRNSGRMVKRGQIYLDRGYSLLLLDAPSHGQSQWVPIVYAIDFARYAKKICLKEEISTPIVHGLSFGSIAGLLFTQEYKSRAIIAEALINDFTKMYEGFFNVMRIPKMLFWWIPWLILRYSLEWDAYSPKAILPRLEIPIFLIHGGDDEMFPVESHFNCNLEIIEDQQNVYSWIVDKSPHSKMAQYPGFSEKINQFIDVVEDKQLEQVA